MNFSTLNSTNLGKNLLPTYEKMKSCGGHNPEEIESRIGKAVGTERNPLSGDARHEGAD